MSNQVDVLNEGKSKLLLAKLSLQNNEVAAAMGLALDLKLLWPPPCCGRIDTYNTHLAGSDFGNLKHFSPAAVLYPGSVRDIENLVKWVYKLSPYYKLTVAARGHGHSIHGQAQAPNGVVIDMGSLRGIDVHKHELYADVSGGELWIDVLHATLKEGVAPRSFTDYLYLSVGGTLSNAGISGQAFQHGPQISNVLQLDVVTGKGDLFNCSREKNAELFHAALGGLGQFGIITKARIQLEPAPQRVRWIRVLYSDFEAFTRDQEYLISQPKKSTFDYVEGFVIVNNEGLLSNWRSSFFSPQNPVKVSTLNTKGRVLYCLEMTKNYDEQYAFLVDEEVEAMLAPLNYIPASVFTTDLGYLEFLDRVHTAELKLRSKGMWDVPHPWLNLLIPRSKIAEFDSAVFKGILRNISSGPILVYPLNRNRWDERTSAVIPDDDIFYLVGLLRSAFHSSSSPGNSLDELIDQNERILRFCRESGIGEKQYLPHYTTEADWKVHFGAKWPKFVQMKALYDPSAILSPGQQIFMDPDLSTLHYHSPEL
ncbi:hypothetical protein SUGI_0265410 [Cryptomeria japonica]|uniref:cytokinin dehydrogenase 9 n=1 Tax=Cryptomeria japonica TaxID=3369 RepID=UPI002408A5FE|nr:cytokinin dehydrogenase 9 [Cryptomeria japonica]GLJ16015.1 hypothetical protein SUGI_0265410 [Cryptomeria japonica]